VVRLSFKLRGEQAMIAKLRRLAAEEPQKVGRALFEEGEDIMREAKRITPVETGTLRGSGHVELPKTDMGGVSVELGFGGAAAPYAIYVHEIPAPPERSPAGRSARHAAPTQWKYLETPFRAAQHGIARRLADKLKAWLR
jgi:hypothetical protein